MKHVFVFVSALFLFAFAASAQRKTEAAIAYLGETYYTTMPAGKAVWHFERGDIHTSPNGTWSFERDLTNRFSFQDAVSYGPLLSVTINGRAVRPSAPVAAAKPKAEAQKPQPLYTKTEASALPLPDSVSAGELMSGIVEGSKAAYDHAADVGVDAWGGFWEVYDYAKYAIWCAIFLMLFWASFTKNEFQNSGTWGDNLLFVIQRNISSVLGLSILFVATLYLIQFMVWLSQKNIHIGLKLLILVAVVFLVQRAANRITPSITNHGSHHSNRVGGGNYKQLNNG